MAHPGGGDELGDTVHHAEAGPEDRNQGELLARHLAPGGALERGLDLDRLRGQVLGYLISHQGGNLPHQLLEIASAGVLVPENGKLVLDQGVGENDEIGEWG